MVVTNTPGVLTDATADLAIALMLAATRRMSRDRGGAAPRRMGRLPPDRLARHGAAGQDARHRRHGPHRPGDRAARGARLRHARSIYFNRSPVGPFDFPAEARPTIEAVLAEADVVSLHVPGGGGNRGLISAERLAAMKPTAYLVNTARGDVVDEPALIAALRRAAGIAGAGLDVYAEEPKVPAALLRAAERHAAAAHRQRRRWRPAPRWACWRPTT